MRRCKLARPWVVTRGAVLAMVTIRTIKITAPRALSARIPPDHLPQDEGLPRRQYSLSVPEVSQLVARLGAKEVALVAELPAPVLVLDPRVELFPHLGRGLGQLLVHTLVLRVHQVVLLGEAVRGPLRRRDVDRPGGWGHAVPGGARPGR